MKKLLRKVFSRFALVALFVAVQSAALVLATVYLKERFEYFYLGCLLLSALIVLHIIRRDTSPAYKIAWIILVMVTPLFGGLFYLFFGRIRFSSREQASITRAQQRCVAQTKSIPGALERLDNPDAARMAQYLENSAGARVCAKTQVEYLECGEVYFDRLREQLEKAEKFIFMEYYIIEEGKVWDSVLEILKRKASAGVEVRLLYDDFGTTFKIPDYYDRTLKSYGIDTCVFNRFRPELSPRFNNRDHRKIVVIDGIVGFTGGINIADRYANSGGFDGHWLDSGVLLRGLAAQSLCAMFIAMWDSCKGCETDPAPYLSDSDALAAIPDDGFVCPFSDTPLDEENVGENVYMGLISRAKDYVYINTPYLIIDYHLLVALCNAAKSGVDVRLVTPGRSGSKMVQSMSRSYYQTLIEAGVKIYEYTPGMIHAKTAVSDDLFGVVGTINLDYRSLYLHFECAVWLYGSAAVAELKRQYLAELEQCALVTLEHARASGKGRALWYAILRVLSPLF